MAYGTSTAEPRYSRRRVLSTAGRLVAGSGGLMLLVACGAGQPTASGTTTSATAPVARTSVAGSVSATTVSSTAKAAAASPGVLGATVNFLARGNPAIFNVFHQEVTAFHQLQPDISVTVQEVPGDWHSKLQAEVAGGEVPDATFECDCTLGPDVQSNMIEPIDAYLAKDKVAMDQFWPIAFYASTYANKKWGMPYDGGSMALYYNKDLFNAAQIPDLSPKQPAKWDDILPLAQKLTLDDNGKHPGDSGFDPTKIKQYGLDPSRGYWQVYVWAFGGEVIDKDGHVPLDSAEAAEGIQYLADLGLKHLVSPAPQFPQKSSPSFQNGTVAISYGGVWSSVSYRQSKFDWDVAPFPVAKAPVSTGWYSPLSLLSGGKNKDAAWQWIYFCTTTPGQKIVAGLGEDVPDVQALAQTDAFLDPKVLPQHKQVFLDAMSADLLRVPGDRYGSYFGGQVVKFRDTFNQIYDPVWKGQTTAATAGTQARPQLEAILKEAKFP